MQDSNWKKQTTIKKKKQNLRSEEVIKLQDVLAIKKLTHNLWSCYEMVFPKDIGNFICCQNH